MSNPKPGKIGALLLILSLSACARPIGDFGRPEISPPPNFFPFASAFNLTDQEKQMRDRIWRYLVAPEDYDWFGDSLTELQRTSFTTSHFRPPPRDRYYLWLRATAFASSPVRYARLADDIKADLNTMRATFDSVCTVEGIDRQREIAARELPEIETKMVQQARTQHAENLFAVVWFSGALEARYQSYSYALDHLLLETPHGAAISADADLSDLQVYVAAASSDDFCAPRSTETGRARQLGTDSRSSKNSVPTGGS